MSLFLCVVLIFPNVELKPMRFSSHGCAEILCLIEKEFAPPAQTILDIVVCILLIGCSICLPSLAILFKLPSHEAKRSSTADYFLGNRVVQ